jgi:hypothetical protein
MFFLIIVKTKQLCTFVHAELSTQGSSKVDRRHHYQVPFILVIIRKNISYCLRKITEGLFLWTRELVYRHKHSSLLSEHLSLSLHFYLFMARILSCLMEHLYTEKMVEDCEHRLLELQYFISRDWK